MKYNSSISQKHTAGSTLVWLAYTLFFFITPIFQPSRRLWLGTIGFFVLFLCVFLVYTRTTSEITRRLMIAATFAIGLACFPWNGGASTFFIYTAAFLPFSVEATGWVLAFFSLEAVGIALESWLCHIPWQSAVFAIFLLLIIGGGNIFFAQQRRADCKLRAAQEENVALAALAERERIARDLHDVLGHTLSVIVLKAELAGRLIDRDPQRAASEIAEVERTARNALAEVREAIGGYRARGLVAEIEAARRTLDAAGVTLQCDAMPSTNTGLRANEETVLALALREAVTNIVRWPRPRHHLHACASHMEDGQHRLTRCGQRRAPCNPRRQRPARHARARRSPRRPRAARPHHRHPSPYRITGTR